MYRADLFTGSKEGRENLSVTSRLSQLRIDVERYLLQDRVTVVSIASAICGNY
jgi:hypothetical protein